MVKSTFVSGSETFEMFLYPSPAGKKYPVVVLAHGNAGHTLWFGDQIRGFAEDLATLGYFAAVIKYYSDNEPHLLDQTPHDRVLSDAIDNVSKRPGVDPARIGLIGFSLGAATAMTYIATKPKGTIKVLADFFGFLTPTIRAGLANFPPTLILHDEHDGIVSVQNSRDLDRDMPSTVEHSLITYDETWELVQNHSLRPGGPADVDSRMKTANWFVKYMPPVGI